MSVRPMVRVDPRLCEGHALCLDTAPELFDVGDDDVAICVSQPDDVLRPKAQAAVDACPRGAISLLDQQPDSAR